mgnify:CR=1 FL=1
MERLQAAIEKAREQREQTARKRPDLRQKTALPKVEADVWTSLTPIQINRRVMRRNRIVAFEGGPPSGPFDMLRTRMLEQAREHGWRRLAVTSPDSMSGKTTTVANLAFSLQRRADVRTLVLDFDLRRGRLARMLGQKVDYTMADVIERRIKFSEHGRRYGENVIFGLNGSAVRNPSELLQSQSTTDMLAELERAYEPDVILFDLPPMMATDDSFGFLKNVDCALLLAAAERTSMDRIDVAERQVAELTNVMGIVLNKSRYTDGAYGYDYGYY